MRPVYFSVILSLCYGLSSCNYILIPQAAQLWSRVPPLSTTRCPSLVTVSNETFPLSFPCLCHRYDVHLSSRYYLTYRACSFPLSFVALRASWQKVVVNANTSTSLTFFVSAARLTSTDWIMVVHWPPLHPSQVTILFFDSRHGAADFLPVAGTQPICFALQIELQFSVNRKLPPWHSVHGNSLCIPFISLAAPLAATSASLLNYRVVTILW